MQGGCDEINLNYESNENAPRGFNPTVRNVFATNDGETNKMAYSSTVLKMPTTFIIST